MTQQSMDTFLKTLSSSAPVPGGGGASAYVAAVGMSLGSMVANLTTGKKKYAEYQEEIEQIIEKAGKLTDELADYMQKDAVAFEPLSKAYGLPKDTEEEKTHREEVLEKSKINSFKREKVNNPDHAHILSGILKCPCCGKSMYGNIAKAHSKDKKTRYYYYCKNTVTPTGHECSFRLNIEQTEINKFVAKVISAMVNNPRFVEAIQAKIGTAVDTEDMERQIAVLQGRLKQAFGTKSRLERQMDTLDINDAHYDRKILDLQRRYDEQYDTIEEIEVQIGELQSQIRSIQQEKISGDNIYRLLLAFDEVYHSATEAEQKEFMKAFIERIEMFPEKRKDGSWIKKIVFNFPVPVDGEEVKELPLETETTVECVVLLSKV